MVSVAIITVHYFQYRPTLLVITTRNKRLNTGKQENRYWVQVSQGEGKPPQTEHAHGD